MSAPAALAAGADLVIGVGNPLRGDDGAGWWLARRARRHRPAPAVRLVRQVTPELALELAEVRRVLFVDAWCAEGPDPAPLLRPLRPEQSGEVGVGGGHGLDPAGLLALAGLLGGATPPGWLLLVPAFAFPHGTDLSDDLRARLPAAGRLLEDWLAKKPA
ncbi:hydrogenase maturation protease [Cyanobium sp. FGCU-52]|nr:hydrogenase maturation protease [Cyanobium sp. FGCU52]